VKLKTALELLKDRPDCGCGDPCNHELEWVARRAREEAYEMAAKVAIENSDFITERSIRALPTEPK
jgi:hypothetical protein